MHQPQVVCILGMHRSGTSLIARVINLLGVDLGPSEQMLEPGMDNVKGFWEHVSFKEIDDELLARHGGDWSDPPELPTGWHEAPELDELRERARAMIAADFGGSKSWGWKDPRSCLTLPFWRALVPAPRFVIPMRRPLDVARSLEHRNGMPLAQGIRLWVRYVREILDQTADEPRTFVFYEDFLDGWRRDLPRLARFLGRPELGADPEVVAEVGGFIDKDLRHHRTGRPSGPGRLALAYYQVRGILPQRFAPRVDVADPVRLGLPQPLIAALDRLYDDVRQVGLRHDLCNDRAVSDDAIDRSCSLILGQIEAAPANDRRQPLPPGPWSTPAGDCKASLLSIRSIEFIDSDPKSRGQISRNEVIAWLSGQISPAWFRGRSRQRRPYTT